MWLTRSPWMPATASEFDRLFNRLTPGSLPGEHPFPAVNAWEEGDRLHVEAEAPGLNMEDIELLVVGDELTIKGRRDAGNGDKRVFHRRERGAGEFTRVLALPCDVDTDNVEATLKNGVLTIILPKAEAARTRKITVRAG